jgi:hypothetical protein
MFRKQLIGSQDNRIIHCVPFRENNKEYSINLSLLSHLDYTIKLEYTHSANRNVTTLVIRARTQTQCTEWYMAIYRALPESDKKPITPWTEIFVPDLNIQIRIPLQDEGVVSNQVNVTAQCVEKAAIHLLHNDPTWSELLANISNSQQFGLCWTIHDRIEWIPLAPKHDRVSQSNFIIGPQSIEQVTCGGHNSYRFKTHCSSAPLMFQRRIRSSFVQSNMHQTTLHFGTAKLLS